MESGQSHHGSQHAAFISSGITTASSSGFGLLPSTQVGQRSSTSSQSTANLAGSSSTAVPGSNKKKPSRRRAGASSPKRRCVSTACVACRKRKSKCDGALPSCAACASVYGTECIYDPNSDHRRKGVYKDKVDTMKARNSTLQILVEAMLNSSEEEAYNIVRRIRTCDSLDTVAEQLLKQDPEQQEEPLEQSEDEDFSSETAVEGERDLARKMGELRLENGSVRYIGGTSHLIYLGDPQVNINNETQPEDYSPGADPRTTWTRVTDDSELIQTLIDKYFYYHYPYFTTLSRKLFEQDFWKGRAGLSHSGTVYCSSLLVNAMLALGCHFTDIPEAFGTPSDNRTKGDHFFAEAKRLIVENGEYEKPRLVTVQALALMSVREAGCAREAKGWVYSGMSFRMAQDIGLNLEMENLERNHLTEHEIDARRITFWGCFLFDKCWSNYLGRLPLLAQSSFNVSKFDVFPDEDAETWMPFPDSGLDESLAQPCRTRAVALQLSKLCEISSDLLVFFYHPNHIGRSSGKAVELKKLSELHRRLEEWRKELPSEFEPKDGQLPNVILMHMFFHLQYIHLFRPFLKYAPSASPLPTHVSPRRICTANAGSISKLMRLYKKTYNLRQICNIAVYMTHSACTIHLLNLPEKTAKRDIIHGVRHLEEIAEDWLCARRTLCILSVLARKWKCQLPEDAAFVLQRTDEKYGFYSTSEVPSPASPGAISPSLSEKEHASHMSEKGGSICRRDLPGNLSQTNRRVPSISGVMTMGSMETQVADNMSFLPPLQQDSSALGGDDMVFAAPGPLGSWGPGAPPPPSAPPQNGPDMPGHASTFDRLDQSGLGSSGGAAAATPPQPPYTRHMPSEGVNIDGPDWFLNDSARWQQSFETWDLNGANHGGGGPMFLFSDGSNGAVESTEVSGDTVNGRRQQTLRSESGDQTSGFEGLGVSLSGTGWLPGLD